ncbi:polymorphic toxin-type HINT domain-containing protein [Salinispora arenicola]|uniref:polymorphic toxin-type HINT domain-containing protein n=1 Tax=Salinispora arenicola TaxID=168697 RepID=UPI001E381C1D|nr:polymorphic toxin-type HINT domain-containing protein [Salinispora arenicola]
MTLTMLGEQPEAVAAPTWDAPTPREAAGVATRAVTAKPGRSDHADSRVVAGAQKVVWPSGTAVADVAAATAAAGRARGTRAGLTGPPRARAGSLPITVSSGPAADDMLPRRSDVAAVTAVKVNVHDRAATAKAGVEGLLVSASRADGKPGKGRARVQVDYAGFAQAYGGGWASRLRLVQLPECALTTPEAEACRTRTPLVTDNDPANREVSASVSVGAQSAMVLAVEAEASGDNGDYTATSLSPAGQWQVSTQTGDFSWSYPLRVPPSLGGPAPEISFDYSSGSIDGRTALTNNQGSWIGDGWDSWPGFIERKYQSCADDNPGHKTGDLCWFSDNATLSLNGHAGELIRDGSVWRLRNDDGTRVERLTNSARGNGDNDNEYWKVTTPDGMQYFFGYHRLPGWSSGKPVTDSTWTVPVFGNNSGEPCYKSSFEEAYCTQAWRWNLDYVVDPNSNTMAYFYGTETGAYARDNDPDQRTTYDRGGYLKRIEYGMRANAEYGQAAPLRVVFTTAERCLTSCWSGAAWTSDPVSANWHDTPWDQYCKTAPCTTQGAPTFWTAHRLTKVTAQTRNGATSYADVESWTLRQEFINAGTGESTPMWLRGITRTGHVTTAGGDAVSDPEITFSTGAHPLPNRVDGPGDGRTALNRWRIKAVRTESGGDIIVSYSDADCTRSTLPDPATNTKRCMPSYYDPDEREPTLDWFHKYVVTRVDLDDTATDQPTEVTMYDYDTPAWAYNTDELTKDKYRTWSDWRGYGKVTVRHGDPSGQQTAVEHRYLRGLDGDKASSGVRDVWVTDSWGGRIEDHEALKGFELQTITKNGPSGAEVSSTRNDPWINGPTATRSRDGITTKAWMVDTDIARARTALAAGGHRYVKTVTSFNSDGLSISVEDHGDEAIDGDETCTRTSYARNDAIWMIDRPSQVETLSRLCAGAPATADPATVLHRARSFYDTYTDDSSHGRAPTKGNIVRTEELETFTGSTPVYARTSTTAYDTNGRITAVTDPRGHTTTTAHTTANGGQVVQTVVTNPKGHTSTTLLAPAWAAPTKVTDANGAVTDLTYDGLGRLTNVWKPGRNQATQKPSVKFAYQVRNSGGPTTVTTESLLPTGTTFRKSVNLYDGFLRLRQNQLQATGGGRTITDTMTNSLGATAWTSAPYYDSTNTEVNTSLATPQGQIPSITRHTYDGAGRPTAQILIGDGVEKWRTTTSYGGDRVYTIPPAGGTATTTITHGLTSTLRQYKNAADVGSDDPATFDTTTYTHTLLGQLETVTDVTGANTWSHTYDLRGRQTQAVDPDKGTTTSTYDAAGNITTSTGTGRSPLAYTYDELGRKTSVRDDTPAGTTRAEWEYDTLPNGIGKLTAATRYTDGEPYTSRVNAYDAYGRPTSTSLVLPDSQSELCTAVSPNTCTYTTTHTYRANGQPWRIGMPAAADLPAETLILGYTDVGAPAGSLSPAQIYAHTVIYNKLDQLTQYQFGQFGRRIAVTSTIDEPTRRLTSTNVVPELKPEAANHTYTYDDVGNVTEIHDTPTGGTADHQCFTFDYLRRMTEAWTPESGACATTPATWNQVDGATDPYWHTWTFDHTGNRTTETRHGTTNTTHTYTYPNPGESRPHAVTTVTASGADTWNRTYTYDDAGNTTTRPTTTGDTQTLTWDREGKLTTTTTDTTGDTSYIYDADGNRLIRTDPTGKTLYLPGGTEVRHTTDSTTQATRYYTFAGRTIAIRTATNLDWIISDHHGTAQTTIDATTLTTATRRTLPYGEKRATTTGAWPIGLDKGFLGGTQDPTGLTHLNAREYDPTLGRFISVDPIMDLTDPQQWNGYAYANNNPVTYSDPSGLAHLEGNSKGNGRIGYQIGNTIKISGKRPRLKPPPKSPPPSPPPGDSGSDRYPVCISWSCWEPEEPKEVCGSWNAYCSPARDPATAGVQHEAAKAIIGVDDFNECFKEQGWAGCAWLIGGVTPWGKAVKTVKAIRAAGHAGRAARAGRACSFSGDTDVLMADGSTKAIEDVSVGDRVLATDPETGEEGPREVTHLWVHDDQLVDLNVDGGDITTTEDHPFWNETDQQWQESQELDTGDLLHTAAGETLAVVGLDWSTARHDAAYNLTVADIHTYYVLAGNTPVLVHNTNGCWPGVDGLSASAARPAKGGLTHAGREYQKHMGRGELPKVPGKQLDTAGQDYLDDILTTPGTQRVPINGGAFQGGYYYIRPDGAGAAFDSNGVFQYFGKF